MSPELVWTCILGPTEFIYLFILLISISEVIPEALQTTCGKCTPKQKELIRQVIRGIMEKHPDSWKELIEKFDKDGKYRENFDKFLADKE